VSSPQLRLSAGSADTPAVLAASVQERRRRSHRSGGTLLVGIDGRSGAGKTALALALGEALQASGTRVVVVHLDDMYAGWDGLAAALPRVREGVLAPLALGQPGRYTRWDWHRDTRAGTVVVPPAPVVVVEGVGAVAADPGAYDLRVWAHAPAAVRRRRALDRDGQTFASHWDRWAAQEDTVLGPDAGPVAPWPVDALVTADHDG
jgi:hypothetical protein